MRIRLCTSLVMVTVMAIQAQVLNGDQRFPVLNQIQWGMNKEMVLSLCAANNVKVGGNDSTITFDADFFGIPSKAVVRFKDNAKRLQWLEVKFKEHPVHLPDTLASHFTRTLGGEPGRTEKEKSALLITLRMEIAVWKTTKGSVTLLVAKQNKSIFDVSLTIRPTTQ